MPRRSGKNRIKPRSRQRASCSLETSSVLPIARSLRCTSRQLTSAPRETRTPTRDTPDKALNLASRAIVVSGEVQIVRQNWISRTIWTVRDEMDVATVCHRRVGGPGVGDGTRIARLPAGTQMVLSAAHAPGRLRRSLDRDT